MKEWNDLPSELQSMCIDPLDFESKCQMRCVCRAAKALVDKMQIKVQSLELEYIKDDGSIRMDMMEVPSKDFNDSHRRYISNAKGLHVLRFIFHHAKWIETLFMSEFPQAMIERIQLKANLDVLHLKFATMSNESIMYLLGLCKSDKMQTFASLAPYRGATPLDYITVPTSANIRRFRYDANPVALPIYFALKWIVDMDNDYRSMTFTTPDLGATYYETVKGAFLEKFWRREIVTGAERFVRITTDNPGKHIVLGWLDKVKERDWTIGGDFVLFNIDADEELDDSDVEDYLWDGAPSAYWLNGFYNPL